MTQYLLSVYMTGDEADWSEDEIQKIYGQVDEFNAEVKAAGAWVFAGGLHPPETATVVRVKDGDVLVTDGPYVEGKEHVGGFTVIDAPDLDAAMGWARKLSQALALPGHATGMAVEVRPFQHGG